MWNISRFGHGGSMIGPNFTPQKRDFSFNLTNLNIAPGKSFQNPNFVNNHYPSVHPEYINQPFMTNHICHTTNDIPKPAHENVTQKSSNENSSQYIVKPVEEKIVSSPVQKIPVENKQMCHNRKRCKKSKSHRRKESNRSSKQHSPKRHIREMMEIDSESDISMNSFDSNLSRTPSYMPPENRCPMDYIVSLSTTPNKFNEPEENTFTFISITPPGNNKMLTRERELSVCESEDSFIIFESGTDEELNFSDDSANNTESESDIQEDSDSGSDDEYDVDSANSVVPCKRVRFAENEDLCEIHPMVQWSFAYRNARKGPWEEYARDRHRFNKRIHDSEELLSQIFDRKHRENVYRERFENYV